LSADAHLLLFFSCPRYLGIQILQDKLRYEAREGGREGGREGREGAYLNVIYPPAPITILSFPPSLPPSLPPSFPRLVAFECAFTVEGRADEELPEVVMGMGKFCKIDVKRSVALEY